MIPLIPFKEEHQGLSKLHVIFFRGEGWGVPVWKEWGYLQKENFLWSGKMTCKEAFQNLLKSCLSFGGSLEDSNCRASIRPSLPFSENWKKVPWFWKKCPDSVLPWVKFSVQNVVLKISMKKTPKFFPVVPFFSFIFDEMFIKVSLFHEISPALKHF